MWTKIKDCGKQLSLHSIVSEKDNDHFKIYNIIEVEFDQYKLELIQTDNHPPIENLHLVLNCRQLLKYNFEVEKL